jgi:signal transduction histidine kinase
MESGMKRFGLRSTYNKLNAMLDAAIDGTFEESDYDESELSKLEAKWKRFLSSSKLSQKKIEEDREKIRELLTDISHQTKTPLSNILLYTQLLQEKDLNEEALQLLEEIQIYSEKLEFLIQSLVKTSRLETGTFQYTPANNDINELIRLVVNQACNKAAEQNIGIHIMSTETCYSLFDLKWTREAVYNILDNAIKYSGEGSQINISHRSYELFVCIEIADTGIGIPEEELPKIFGRFTRGSNVREQEGVGIGLYLSRQIIEGQGGYIKVTSALNKGSRFQIYLPRITV